MTDTGQIPGEGLPENAGAEAAGTRSPRTPAFPATAYRSSPVGGPNR